MKDPVLLISSLAPDRIEDATVRTGYIMIRCPFPKHAGGQEATPSCSIRRDAPVFFCHGCQECGHVSKLLRVLGAPRSYINQVFGEWDQGSEDEGLGDLSGYADNAPRYRREPANPYRGEFILSEDILDPYRMAPRELVEAGFKIDTLRHFEVGVDPVLRRYTFPLRTIYGDLVGVSGRSFIHEEPRYLIYRRRHIMQASPGATIPWEYTMENVRGTLLWHGHLVYPFLMTDDSVLVITEGFKACMWVYQHFDPCVVALVGSKLTDYHARLIPRVAQRVVLMLDNNSAGISGTTAAGRKLVKRGVEVWVARYPDSREQPDDLNPDELVEAIQNADPYIQRQYR